MTTTAPSKRDTRIDVFRALALLTIFVNHVPGTIYEYVTHKHFGFSDSAEAFVLISGIAIGLAYGTKFKPGNRLLIAIKAWRRAGVLYVTHIMTTMATLAIFAGAAVYFARLDLLTLINIKTVMEDTPRALFGIVTLGHQLGYNNILSMYAALLVMMPLFLVLSNVSLRLTVAVSGLIWLACGVYKIAPVNYPTAGYWFLNPLSWQFLFVIGFAAMLHVKRGGDIAFRPWLAGAAAAYALLALAWVRVPLWGVDISFGLPAVLTGFDKTFLSLPRLAHVLALAYLVVAIPVLSNLARTRADNPLAILGRHSLPIFIAGTVLAMIGQVMKTVSPGGTLYDTVLLSTGIALQFALAYYLDWLAKARRGADKPSATTEAPRTTAPRPLGGKVPAVAVARSPER